MAGVVVAMLKEYYDVQKTAATVGGGGYDAIVFTIAFTSLGRVALYLFQNLTQRWLFSRSNYQSLAGAHRENRKLEELRSPRYALGRVAFID